MKAAHSVAGTAFGALSRFCLAAFLLSSPGCSAESSDQTVTAPIEQAGGFALASAPVLEIADSGNGPYQLAQISDATRLPDGTVAIVDPVERRIALFDSTGTWLRYLGRGGAGPAEFEAPIWIERCGAGVLHVHDIILARVMAIDLDGTHVGQFKLGAPPFRLACDSDGRFALIWSPVPGSGGSGFKVVSGSTAILSSSGDSIGTIGRVPVASPRALGEAAVVAIGAGRIVYGSSEGPELSVFDVDGNLVETLDTRVPRRRATEANHDAAIEEQLATIARSDQDEVIRKMLKDIPMPDLVPAYRDAFIDPQGNVWVVTSAVGDGLTELRVFAKGSGEAVTLRLPIEVKVLEVGEGYLLAKRTETSGATHVLLYSARSPARATQ